MKKIKLLIATVALLISANGFGQFWYSTLTYDVSVPLGNTADYVSETSFRGASFRVGRYLTDNLATDMRFSWATFYEARGNETYSIDDGTADITGKQFRYINAFPWTVGLTYFLNSSSDFQFYFSGGIGAYKINERTDMGIYYVEDKVWHFGMYPEIGFNYDVSYSMALNLFARYEYALAAKNTTSHSWLAIGIGLHFKN